MSEAGPALRGRQLAVIVSAPGELARAAAVALAARALSVEVSAFIMADAVDDLARAPQLIAQLADEGVDLIACAHSAHLRGVSAALAGVVLGSQDDHAATVHRADRVLAFT